MAVNLLEKLQQRYKPQGECWVWTGYITPRGYGHFSYRENGKARSGSAYKLLYELTQKPVDPGKQLDHKCRNRACVNPAHLEEVTQRVNILRGESFAAVNFHKTECTHGHKYTPETLYVDPRGKRECKICRREAVKRYILRKDQ